MQKRHRIFIAINLPPEVRQFLSRYEKKWPELGGKWVTEYNLHITLAFLVELNDQELGEVCMAVKNAVRGHQSFEVVLNRVCYGPENKIPPRMVWAVGEKNHPLSDMKRAIENALMEKIHFVKDKKSFSPHVTLARLSAFLWRSIEPEERPEVAESLELVFTVQSVEVMESELKKGGPVYQVIESFHLE